MVTPARHNPIGMLGSFRQQQGFSMIEIIIVVALIAFVYSIAIPQFSARTGSEAATKISRLTSDIRSAYDMAVLNNRPYRLAFNMASGDYQLEEADRRKVYLGDSKVGHDATEEEEKSEEEFFEDTFKEYESLAGDVVNDTETDEEIKPTSPTLEAKDRLKKPKWSKVENLEWTSRTLGPFLLISEMQAEHHGEKQLLGDLGEKGRVFLYFFPAGFVEKAYFRVSYRKGDFEIDESQPPYTVITNSLTGTADVISGVEEVDVNKD